MKIEIELTENEYIKLLKISSYKKLSKEEYTESIIKKDLESSMYLEYGYVYDLNKKALMHGNHLILLNKLEEQLFEYLIKNIDQYVSSEKIIDNVVKLKPMSIFAMRNQIKNIRDKTHKKLVISKSNIGYMIKKLIASEC